MKPLFALAFIAFASTGNAASFDCAKASTLVEKAICSESQLSDLDDSLQQSYKKAMASTHDAAALKSDQRAWLTNVRNKCPDSACLKRVYTERVASLSNASHNSANVPNQATTATAGSPLVSIKAVPETTPDKGIKSRYPFEMVGKIEFGHDAAGGKYVVSNGKKEYSLGYVWFIDDATQDQLVKISESGATVTVKGTLKVRKDGSADFDNADSIRIYK
jgi:uncharacterized protein